MSRRRMMLIGSALGAAVAIGFAACKLDLDESLIPDDGGSDVSTGGNAGSAGWANGGTSGVGGFGAAPADAGPCDADPQCAIDGGCLEGRCISGQCNYAVCPAPAACEGRACDFANSVCADATTLGFKLNQINVGADLGCSGSASRCIATAGEYVIVGTSQSSLLGWHLKNPLSPVKVNVEAPPFAITRLVSNENRVLIVGPTSGGKLSLAWIDVPTDDIPTDLTSQAVAVNFSGTVSSVYPSNSDDFFLVENDAGLLYPSVRLDLPVANNSSVSLLPCTGLPSSQTVVAASGTRLVAYRTDTSTSSYPPVFSLETNAGTTSAQNLGEQTLGPKVPTSLGAHVFASSYDGSLLWSTNRIVDDDGSTYANAVVLRWVLLGSATTFDASVEVAIETYSSYGTDEGRAGPVALIDADSAIATAAYPPDTAQSVVKPVKRNGSTLTLGGGSDVIPFSTGALGVTGTRSFGVVLTPSTTASPDPPNTALRIYSPDCG
jgi:hypothetical protein